MTSGTGELPKAVALMWGLEQPGGRGPKRGLSLEQIIEAAIAIGDAEGFAALSMNRVARELGFTAMSLYRYVDSKATLMEMMLDHVIGLPPEIEPGTSWRAGLAQWARSEYEVLGRHPWALDISFGGSPPLGPNNMAWLEAGLGTLREVPVPDAVKLQLVMNLSLYVIGRRRAARDIAPSLESEADFTEPLRQLLDPQQFPALLSALSNRAFDDDDIDWEQGDFEFGMERLLDGYECFVNAYGS
ncbi:TetR/AcrR family transcriptional regulator [Nocardia cyriacigeorgica]|uniref:TetR/AcrR family transcriptional regulator n=1 Tax=Nocardia cyriacigeorgica TaxID=135487 RepID=UPI0018960024|nr:TetR/AcrR family transcriptional regulator [Nocardia cyriacigeorgica]MBF6456012.1 TetR/AcrR family transcriptional regulator C-terminal domain-containing protein [Nocardia cyriacigeorgica]MBF6478459.1 TetR/AcrR family transcriptional regulator C-terminal domain-containing protein [Nocardia cyriacigeorgica]MBF6553247.1 TetR/AcrR family transcriptional regulator C-terminal domain-containing protein [Nocardia cyriacigeorgica]